MATAYSTAVDSLSTAASAAARSSRTAAKNSFVVPAGMVRFEIESVRDEVPWLTLDGVDDPIAAPAWLTIRSWIAPDEREASVYCTIAVNVWEDRSNRVALPGGVPLVVEMESVGICAVKR